MDNELLNAYLTGGAIILFLLLVALILSGSSCVMQNPNW